VAEVFRIPLINEPQRFVIDLNGKGFIFSCRYNTFMEAWALDILDEKTATTLISCIPLIPGINLLQQHRHIGINGALIVTTDGDTTAYPTADNLGSDANLYFLVDYE
jgi:hypothetical protein